MKNDIYEILKFRLDEESYSYEFEIIPIPPYEFVENNLSLEPYEYFGEVNSILGFRTQQIILYFNADRLMRVEIKFKGNVTNYFKSILEQSYIDFQDTIMFLKMYHLQEFDETVLMYQSTLFSRSI